jgi:hypothetical protein
MHVSADFRSGKEKLVARAGILLICVIRGFSQSTVWPYRTDAERSTGRIRVSDLFMEQELSIEL